MNKLYIVVAYDYDDIPTNIGVFPSIEEATTFTECADLSCYEHMEIQEAAYNKNGMWKVNQMSVRKFY